jgi:hypothetical protein
MKFRIVAIAAVALAFCTHTLVAQSSAFTYQGKLGVNGAPANGTYDLRFQLFDDATVGNQVGSDQTQSGLVLSNGLFTTSLDFGSAAFTGADRWLQISAQTNGTGYITLTPRQKVSATPYALRAANAATSDSATVATTATTATTANIATVALSANTVIATNITGTLPDTTLSTNVLVMSSYTTFFTNRFTNNGVYNITVPAGVSQMVAKLWGAGGGRAMHGPNGGGGAFVQKTVAVTAGQTFMVVVGQWGSTGGGAGSGDTAGGAGSGGSSTRGGNGGQGSSLFLYTGSSYILKALAGAGGGSYDFGGQGAPGGNSPLNLGNGTFSGYDGYGGGGAPNAGQNYATNATTVGIASLSAAGGNGGAGNVIGGGGGGGYGGGGGGGLVGNDTTGGGGGGSYGDLIVAGAGPAPGNTNDPYYVYPAGFSGAANGDGEVVLLFQLPAVNAGFVQASRVSATFLTGDGSGVTNVNASSGTGAFNGTFNGNVSGTFSGSVTGIIAGSVSGTISGNGAGLTNLNATNISSGVANDSILSTNIPRLNGSPVFNTTVTASTFVGNGSGLTNVPWVMKWTVVSNTTQTAVGNNGYLLTNNAQVTVTLPSSPNMGETIRIVGTGAGGWKLNQNAGQSILASQIGGQFGVAWIPSVYSNGVYGLVCSTDGSRLAGITGNWITTSTDGGNNWATQTNSTAGVAMSADGTQIISVSYNGGISKSTNGGANWSSLGQNGIPFMSASSSDNGTRLYAGTAGGYVYRSADAGATWGSAFLSGSSNVRAIACSADGTRVCALLYNDQIYTSIDSGTNWTARASFQPWSFVASSTDGLKLVAAIPSGQIYTSSNGGTNWTARLTAQSWSGVASSGDGSHLIAAAQGGLIYVSTDSGVNWTTRESSRDWGSVASSRDGSRLIASTYFGNVYRSTPYWVSTTTVGTAGSLTGPQYGAIELQHIGGGVFLPLSFNGAFEVK